LQRQLDDVDRQIEALPAPVVGCGLATLLEDTPEPTSLEWRAYLGKVVERVVVGPQVAEGVRCSVSRRADPLHRQHERS